MTLLPPILLAGTLCLSLAGQTRPTAFTGARIIPIDGPELPSGTLLVKDGRIVALGRDVALPPDALVVDLAGRTLMPGVVDSHSHIGCMDGPLEGADNSGPIQPDIRIWDGLDPRSATIRRARAGGITTVNVMPGSGFLLSGQTIYLKLRQGRTVDELAFAKTPAGFQGGMKMANGTNSRRQGTQTPNFPGTRAKSAALVREAFVKAQEYQKKVAAAGRDAAKLPPRDLGLEALVEVLEGKRVVHHHTHRQDDVLTVLRLQKEFGFKVVLHHVSEAWAIPDAIAASKAPCSIIMIDSPGGKLEASGWRPVNGAVLEKAGVLVGFHTDDPITDSRWLMRSAALAVRAGMSRERALRALTLDNAKILDLDARVGSLAPGKDADFVVLSGDPLSVYTHVEETWVDGRKVFDRKDPLQRVDAVGGPGSPRDQPDPRPWLALEGEEY